MKQYKIVLIIGIIEILIGCITLFFNIFSLIFGFNTKSSFIFLFVIIASCVSTLIGIGLLKFKKLAYQLLVYFSTVVILSKVLILLNVISLNGALETTVPGPIKTATSIFYHGLILYYLLHSDVKKIFHG